MVKLNPNLAQASTLSSAPSNTLTQEQLTNALQPLVAQIEQLTRQQNETSKSLKSITTTLSSMNSAASSTMSSDVERLSASVERLNERSKKQIDVLNKLTTTVAGSEVHQLPSGEKVKTSDLNAHTMMGRISEEIAGLKSSIDANTEAVTKKSTVTFDSKSVGEWSAQKIEGTVKASLQGVFDTNRQKLVATGESIVKEITATTKADIGDQAVRWERVQRAVEKTSESIEKIEDALQWRRWAWIMLPFTMALILTAGTTWGILQATGAQQIMQWGWTLALGDDHKVWERAGGVFVLGFELVLFVAVTWWITKRAADALDTWGHPMKKWRDSQK